METRPVEPGDHEQLARVLARAFDDDPIQRWVFPSAGAVRRWILSLVALAVCRAASELGIAVVERHHPRDRHLYLGVLGVDPSRHGFRVTRQLRLPAGPPVWLMRRNPR
jgi:hypothetical protein